MKKDKLNIDEFLFRNLNQYQQNPPAEAKDDLFEKLQSGNHPLDRFVYTQLAGNESDEHTDFTEIERVNIKSENHRVDDLIFNQLAFLYIEPSSDFENIAPHLPASTETASRWLSIAALVILGFISCFISLINPPIKVVAFEGNKNSVNSIYYPYVNDSLNLNSDIEDRIENENLSGSVIKQSRNKQSDPAYRNISNNNVRNFEASTQNDFINTDYNSPTALSLGTFTRRKISLIYFRPFEYTMTFEKPDFLNLAALPSQTYSYKSPLGIMLEAGYFFGMPSGHELDAGPVHKDTRNTLNQAAGTRRSGITFSVGVVNRLLRNYQFQVGLKLTNSQSVGKVEYAHKELIVYDSTGAIKGYLLRPAHEIKYINSNTQNRDFSVGIPLQIGINLFRDRLMLGAGASVLYSLRSHEYYDFNLGEMNNIRIQNVNINPDLFALIKFPITKHWSLSTRLGVGTYRAGFGNTNWNFTERAYTGEFRLGLIYHPIITVKR